MLIWASIKADLERLSCMPVGAQVGREEFPGPGLGDVFWLNAGLALENLLKGLIVQSEPALAAGGRMAQTLRTHSLLRLSDLAGLELCVTEAFYLSIATECVMWAGRYPASTKGKEFGPPVFSEADVLAYRGLFDRLVGRYDEDDKRVVTYQRLA